MSVMLLSDAHINTIASWAAHRWPKESVFVDRNWSTFRESRETVSRALHRANACAFGARYREPVDCDDFRPAFIRAAGDLPSGQIWNLISALDYNSDEWPEWPASEARNICDRLRSLCAADLPGGRTMPWTIQDAGHVARLAERLRAGASVTA